MEIVASKNLSPTFICESDGTQAEDAKQMKDYYMDSVDQLDAAGAAMQALIKKLK